jgi:hypothetical protein
MPAGLYREGPRATWFRPGNPSPGPASEERQWPTAREREGDSGLS